MAILLGIQDASFTKFWWFATALPRCDVTTQPHSPSQQVWLQHQLISSRKTPTNARDDLLIHTQQNRSNDRRINVANFSNRNLFGNGIFDGYNFLNFHFCNIETLHFNELFNRKIKKHSYLYNCLKGFLYIFLILLTESVKEKSIDYGLMDYA